MHGFSPFATMAVLVGVYLVGCIAVSGFLPADYMPNTAWALVLLGVQYAALVLISKTPGLARTVA